MPRDHSYYERISEILERTTAELPEGAPPLPSPSARLKRLLRNAMLLVIAAAALLYVVEYVSVRFRIPRSRDPFASVQVQRYYAISKKNNKTEFIYDAPENQVCVRSLFPHLGYTPCWYLRRNPEKRINL